MSNPETDEVVRLAQIRKRLEAATPGPWEVSDQDVRTSAFVRARRYGHVCNAPVPIHECYEVEANRSSQARKNITFIAHAPSDIAWLLSRPSAQERDGVIEECAKVAEAMHPEIPRRFSMSADDADYYTTRKRVVEQIAKDIRSLSRDSSFRTGEE